jgi:hypothetical protein
MFGLKSSRLSSAVRLFSSQRGFILRQTAKTASASGNASIHLCNGCARCFSSTATKSSSSPSAASSSTAPHLNRLVNKLDSEIAEQTRILEVADGDLSTETVLSEFESLLSAGNWQLDYKPGNAQVTLKRTGPSGLHTSLSFNVSEVVNGALNEFENDEDSSEMEEAEASSTSAEQREGEEADEDFVDEEMGEYASFPVLIELERPLSLAGSASGSSRLVMECLAEIADDSPSLTIEKISLLPTDSAATSAAYLGPDYATLDEGLRQQFDKFIEKELKASEMVAFMSAFGQAAEAREYQKWLEGVKGLLKD